MTKKDPRGRKPKFGEAGYRLTVLVEDGFQNELADIAAHLRLKEGVSFSKGDTIMKLVRASDEWRTVRARRRG